MSIDTRNYGFIITRHVNNETTNKYWNYSVQCIRRFYPYKKIIIIDDNSNAAFLKAYAEYANVDIVNSEFPGRGELLPYYYFYKNRYFENAVILHDSVFFQKRIAFERLSTQPVLPFWHFDYSENIGNTLRISQVLHNTIEIQRKIMKDPMQNFGFRKTDIWYGCFGAQCYINHGFLTHIQNKYNLFSLLQVVKTRTDRCCLERIMGAIFYIENPTLYKQPSLLGNIWRYCKWGTTCHDYSRNRIHFHKLPLVKVWSGR
jgi:hypothetical protein